MPPFDRKHFVRLRTEIPAHPNVVGGCCGTDHRHIEQLVLSCAPQYLRLGTRVMVGAARPGAIKRRPLGADGRVPTSVMDRVA